MWFLIGLLSNSNIGLIILKIIKTTTSDNSVI